MSNSERVTEIRESKRAVLFSVKFLFATLVLMFLMFDGGSLVFQIVGVGSFVASVLFTINSLRRQYRAEFKYT